MKTNWILLAALLPWASLAEIRIIVPSPTNRASPAAVSGTAASGSPTGDALVFRNGDLLHGTLLSIVPDTEIRWSHPDAKRPIEFAPPNIVQIKLAAQPAAPAAPPQAVVRLTNGDELRGQIVALDETTLTLQTAYAGELAIQRTMVQTILPKTSTGPALYRGPTDLADWVRPQGDQAWRFRNGALYSVAGQSGPIGRDVKLKDRSRIEFDLAWRNPPYLQISLAADNPENFFGNAYLLQITGNSVQLQRGRLRGGFSNLGGSTSLDNFAGRGKARLSILVDKPKRTIALLVDGALVKQWTDPGDFAGQGGCLMFLSQGQGPMRISNLLVTEWDGELGEGGALVAKADDMIRFSNNDKVSGRLQAIHKGVITFATAFATLEVPLDRAAQIEFASDRRERARRLAGDVRATFHEGGTVTLALEKLDETSLVGSSENFGKRTFARSAFRELRFHIYDESITLSARGDEWEDF
jgi:hypothetical protein